MKLEGYENTNLTNNNFTSRRNNTCTADAIEHQQNNPGRLIGKIIQFVLIESRSVCVFIRFEKIVSHYTGKCRNKPENF